MGFSSSTLNTAPVVTAAGSKQASTASPPIRVILAMASELDRWAWSIVLSKQHDLELVATPSSIGQVLELLGSLAADVVVLDEDMLKGCDRALIANASHLHLCGLILVAMHQPDYSIELFPYPFKHTRLLKGFSASKLLAAIRASAKGSTQISEASEKISNDSCDPDHRQPHR